MKLTIAYIVVTHGPITADYAARFVASYNLFPPESEHDTIICCNGGPPRTEICAIFSSLPSKMFPRPNDDGWDISAYVDLARGPCQDADAMLCLGESCYFHRKGWLARIVSAWNQHGPGMYGSFASNLVRPHLNTTGFVCSPKLLREYPFAVKSKSDRYNFEHGSNSFWKYVHLRGFPVRMVTWDGCWEPRLWRYPHDILWRGTQQNCLMFCSHTERYSKAPEKTKLAWARGADAPYR